MPHVMACVVQHETPCQQQWSGNTRLLPSEAMHVLVVTGIEAMCMMRASGLETAIDGQPELLCQAGPFVAL